MLELAAQVEDAPRHLGIHSGGMVICDRPVIEVCPVEWGRMKDRSVLQWDKDDCAAAGLVKFDLLGLGMLSALHYAIDLIREHRGYEVDLATIPQEDEVYEMLCQADTVGVFQIESRAQMATLPRLRPRKFYDLVVEVALIRPGPIQGGSVHPYIRRRNGQEEPTYLHPLLKKSLEKTLGVPLFQEQLMQMAIDVAGFTPAESDELRQAMGSKRSAARMERLRERLYAGMAERGITGEVADELYVKMKAFANYGFPESHSVSFAYLVYASSWIKYHEPAAFCAALLNAQPMGFWSPHTLVQDARRHGVVVRTPDLNASLANATLEPCGDAAASPAASSAVRLGIGSVRGIGSELAETIETVRVAGGPYRDPEDLVRRVPALNLAQLEAMATAGVFEECFGLPRREALWAVGAVAQSRPDRLAGIVTGAESPRLPGMSPVEEAVADLWATGVSPDGHPTRFLREQLDELGVVTSAGLWDVEPGSRVTVAGVVTHRQRPMTAQGTTFLNLEDETGLINVVVSKGCWARFRRVAREAPAMTIRGRLERSEGVINLVAEHLAPARRCPGARSTSAATSTSGIRGFQRARGFPSQQGRRKTPGDVKTSDGETSDAGGGHRPEAADALGGRRVGREQAGHVGAAAALLALGEGVVDPGVRLRRADLHRPLLGDDLDVLEGPGERLAGAEQLGGAPVGLELARPAHRHLHQPGGDRGEEGDEQRADGVAAVIVVALHRRWPRTSPSGRGS